MKVCNEIVWLYKMLEVLSDSDKERSICKRCRILNNNPCLNHHARKISDERDHLSNKKNSIFSRTIPKSLFQREKLLEYFPINEKLSTNNVAGHQQTAGDKKERIKIPENDEVQLEIRCRTSCDKHVRVLKEESYEENTTTSCVTSPRKTMWKRVFSLLFRIFISVVLNSIHTGDLGSFSAPFRRNPFHFLRTFFLVFLCATSTAADDSWWWPSSNTRLFKSSEICQWARQVGGKQAKMCKNQPSIIEQVQIGIERGMDACQYQMQNNRWNCSQLSKESFQQLMQEATRESGYIQALTAAAITYQITMGCAKGDIAECGCTNMEQLRSKLLRLEARKHNVTVEKEKLKKSVENFDWGGCEDNVEYGIEKSKEFLTLNNNNRRRGRSKVKRKIRLHNEEAGRLAIKNHLRPVCRCHGLTASCTMKVCWNNMPLFSDVSKRLTKKYKSAIRVSLDRNENELVPKQHRRKRKRKMRRNIRSARKRTGHKRYINRPRLRNRISSESVSNKHARRKLTDESLVYTHRSPKFCSTSPSKGSFGTRGRLCDPLISAGWGSCKYMCCKRGFKASNLVERKPCRCRLRGCCTLDCDECTESKTVYHCL